MSDFIPFRARLIAVALAVTALSCAEAPAPQPPPDEVHEDGGSDAGGGCVPGEVGCECSAGTCATGECVANVCEDCRRGEEGCVCRGNGTCNAGLRCAASLCETCPAGAQGCPCATGDTCGAGLVCSNGACTPDTCTPGSPGCPCHSGAPACDGDQYCDDSARCQACGPDVAGCGCGPSGTCTGGLVCEPASQKCRAPTTCADLAASGECKAHQACMEGPGQDAVCAVETCVADYKWDPVTQSCLRCVSEGCTAEPTCEPGDGGLADTCAAQHRLCVQAGASTSCGACAQGYAEAPVADGGSECVPAPVCGTATCGLTDYCDLSGTTPVCRPRPCPPGRALNSDGVCATCNTDCTGAGFTGRAWPFTTKLDVCICETREGYFIESGGTAQAVACDADGDGWVREEADDNTTRGDPALLANARCALRKVDRVRLVDEYGIGKEVHSCRSGLLEAADGGGCAEVVPMRLLETQRNDVPGRPTAATKAPSYGPAGGGTAPSGRLLEAAELNALTKACVSLAADFNDNGKDDIAETQSPAPGADDQERLESFAYFLELYSAFYEAPAQGKAYGTLVLQERSRCAGSFPLHLAAQDGYATDAGISYWRSCSRGRDPEYAREAPQPGFDFAQWTPCAAGGGVCGVTAPPHATLTPESFSDPDTGLLRDHGLCELAGRVPADGKWRGMHHHSQFKCVNVVNPTKAYSFDRLQTEFGTALQSGKLTFNACVAAVCGNTGPACSLSQGEGAQTRQPVVTCTPVGSPAAGALGFAAVNYRPYHRSEAGYGSRTYQGGCINEDDAHWLAVSPTPRSGSLNTFTCPYPEFSLAKADADSAFGRYSCHGKGPNFLWSGTGADPVRAALRWGASATDTARGVLR